MKAMGLTLVKQDCWSKIPTLTEVEISIVLAVAILGLALAVMAPGETQKRRIRTNRSSEHQGRRGPRARAAAPSALPVIRDRLRLARERIGSTHRVVARSRTNSQIQRETMVLGR